MEFRTAPAPHAVPANSVGRIMGWVLAALVPAAVAHVVVFGWGLLVNIVIASVAALAAEALALRLRARPVVVFLRDGSALVTAVLLAFALPPLAPWWLTASGAAFAILFAKHLYGGLGCNPFNPAMVGYVVLLVSFPVQMTSWLAPQSGGLAAYELSFAGTVQTIATGRPPDEISWDAMTMATPLDQLRTGRTLGLTMGEVLSRPSFGTLAGRGWEWVSLATLAGGIALLALGIIRWHIPVAMLTAMTVCAIVFKAVDPGTYLGPVMHLLSGATMLGAFFIATDPVSAATSERGRVIYGAGIGVLTYAIRSWGGYPDGVAFAVLLMNLAVPLIDRYTVPRIYGHDA